MRFLSRDEEQRLRLALDDRESRIRVERRSANQWWKERGYDPLPDLDNYAFADHLKPMVLLSLNTGIRQGELFRLSWENVDFQNRAITVIGTTAKSGKTRHVPLNSESLTVLQGWQKEDNNGLVFPGRNQRPFDNVKKSWSSLLAAAGIKDFRWHDMRHHFASRLVMAGVDLNCVRELLGHSDLKKTLRYAHLAPEHKAEAVARLVGGV